MRAVIQRVSQSSVSVDGRQIAAIGAGFLILLGVGPQDGAEQARQMCRKVSLLRVFSDSEGKMNLSLKDIGGEALVVSQFTLYADTRKGNRPAFTDAAPPDVAAPLVDLLAELLRAEGVPTQTGAFGAHMQVALVNDGPVTILLEM